MDAEVVVIGSGFAGLSAAVRLAEAGVRVAVVEQAPRLGGRATAFADKTTGTRLDNGQHALFGCYRETYKFLATIGTAELAPLDSRLSLVMADRSGRQSKLMCPPLPAPMHLLAGVLSWGALPLVDRWSTVKMAPFLRDARRRGAAVVAAEVPEQMTVAQWLESMGQGPIVREWLWHPLALAALNQSPSVAGVRAFARVLGELFGPEPGASSLGIPTVPLDELYAEPAARFIEARGGQVLRGMSACLREMTSGGFFTVADSRRSLPTSFLPRAVISAVPWHAFGSLWPDGAPAELGATVASASAMVSEPIVSVNLWFDRPVLSERQVGLVGTQFHWAFRAGSKKPPDVISVVASGARDLLRLDNDALIALAEQELRQCIPAAHDATRAHAVVVRESRATFSVAPGSPARPGTLTPLRGFFLAGDWTDTGLPGTIEGAVRSGHAAADAVLGTLTV